VQLLAPPAPQIGHFWSGLKPRRQKLQINMFQLKKLQFISIGLQRVLQSSLIILVKQATAATIVLLSTGLQKGKSELYHLDNSLHQDWRRLWIHLYFASRNKLTQLFRAGFLHCTKKLF
jgi:hypothetical protein